MGSPRGLLKNRRCPPSIAGLMLEFPLFRRGRPLHRRASKLSDNRRLLASIKRLVREVQGPEDSEVAEYYRPYSDELARVRTRPIREEDFLQLCKASAWVLVGDFHTLDQAQQTFLHLLEGLEALGVKPAIALEMVHARYEKSLVRYLKGGVKDCDFLDEIGYFQHWGFDFSHYKPILDHARRLHLPVHALNNEGTLANRDRIMADRIQALSSLGEGTPLLVLVGDLHLAAPHLPAELFKRGIRPPILLQNSESVYIRKLKSGKEPFGWWSLGRGRFLNNNTPPTVKMATYLTWLEHGSEALQMLYGHCRSVAGEADSDVDLAETVNTFIKALKSLFDLHLKTDADVQVFMYNDIEFINDPFFKKYPGKGYRAIILDGRAVYVNSRRTIYIPMLDVNRTVQEAMHYLMRAPLPQGKTQQAFLNRIHYFACGYLASKVLNPMRHSPSLEDMKRAVRSYPWLPSEKERQKLQRQLQVYRAVLQFFKLHGGRSRGFLLEWAPLLRLDRDSTFSLSEQIGRTIGDYLFSRYDASNLSAKELKMYIFQQQNPLALGGPSSPGAERRDA